MNAVIGEDDDALLCVTGCCGKGNWFFPNRIAVPNMIINAQGLEWDSYRNRGFCVVRMNSRRGGVDGVYHCEIPDTAGVNQTIYIGVYTASTGEWYRGFSDCSKILAAVANHS